MQEKCTIPSKLLAATAPILVTSHSTALSIHKMLLTEWRYVTYLGSFIIVQKCNPSYIVHDKSPIELYTI